MQSPRDNHLTTQTKIVREYNFYKVCNKAVDIKKLPSHYLGL
jgi:hypothetical protein